MWSIKYVDCRSMLYSLHLRPLHHDIGNTGKKGKMAAICCYKGKDFDLWMFLGWSLNQQIQSRSEKNYFPKYIWIENLLMTCQQQGPGHLTRRTTRCLAGRRRPWTRRTPTPCSSSSSSCSGSASFSFVLPPWPSAIGTDHAPRVYTSTCLCCTVHVSCTTAQVSAQCCGYVVHGRSCLSALCSTSSRQQKCLDCIAGEYFSWPSLRHHVIRV